MPRIPSITLQSQRGTRAGSSNKIEKFQTFNVLLESRSPVSQEARCRLVPMSVLIRNWGQYKVARDQANTSPNIEQYATVNLTLSHLDPPANGQAVIFLTGLLEVFILNYEIWQQYHHINGHFNMFFMFAPTVH